MLLAASNPLPAGGSRESGREATVEGVVRLVGNEPFTRLVVTAKDGKTYLFEAEKKKTFARFIGLLVTVRGTVEEKELKSADGRVLGVEYLLKNADVKDAGPRDPPK